MLIPLRKLVFTVLLMSVFECAEILMPSVFTNNLLFKRIFKFEEMSMPVPKTLFELTVLFATRLRAERTASEIP